MPRQKQREHDLVETEVNGFERVKCTNPRCDLNGRPSWVRQRAEETDCPYGLDGQTYQVQ